MVVGTPEIIVAYKSEFVISAAVPVALIFGFIIAKSFAKFSLSLGDIIISSNLPYLISILSNEGAGEEIIFFSF